LKSKKLLSISYVKKKRKERKKGRNRNPKHMMEKREPLQQTLLGKLDIHMQKTETRSLSFTLYQHKLKVDQSP
jgi:hypothetical protein